MFSGLKALFGGGITSGQLKVFTKRFVEKKGVVAIREKIHPMFKPKSMKPLESDINYIIVENRKTTHTDLCRQLYCAEIPQEITVVHREWLEECLNKKKIVDVAAYVVHMSVMATTATEGSSVDISEVVDEKKVATSSSSSSSSTSSSSSESSLIDLKRKNDDDESSYPECDETTMIKHRKALEFTCLDPASSLDMEFNTLLTPTGKPSLLYKFAPRTKPSFDRLIAFDMDGTLITTKSGATFSKSVDDWKFLYPEVPTMLRRHYDNGAHLAIISNQNGIAKGHTTLPELIQKLKAITTAIGVPMDILCAFENDVHRKPRTGAFDFLVNQRVGSVVGGATATTTSATTAAATAGTDIPGYVAAARDPDVLANCLYVGDAAGRIKQGTRKKDFSASDYKMAVNAKIGFETPEEFFMNSKQPLHCNRAQAVLGPSWAELVNSNRTSTATLTTAPASGRENVAEILLLVGPPASGKSTLARSLKHTHVRVNQDLLKNKKACFNAASDHFLTLKKSQLPANQPLGVVIDATNSNRALRKEWIDFARAKDVPIHCIEIQVTKDLCFHLAAYRLLSSLSLQEDKRNIEQVVIHTFFKHMEPPSVQEGFASVTRQQFVPHIPDDAEAARLLTSYLK